MSFLAAVRNCLTNYANFKGRASRSEYWWWVLFVVILQAVTSAITDELSGIASLLVLVPGLAVFVRRLHDTNRSGWWILPPFLLVIVGSAFFVGMIVSAGLDLATADSWDPETAFEGASATLAVLTGVSFLLAFLVGIAVFVFTLLRGNAEANKYGPPPPPRGA
jgi:uncharacterized membrane protein YhaH (DUF805 family)